MARRLLVLAVVAGLVAGCGGGGSRGGRGVFARKFSTGGKLMFGLRAYLQSDKDVYIEGETIKLMCALENKSGRNLYLESSGKWSLAKVEARKGDGGVAPIEQKSGRVRREYVKLGAEKSKAVRWFINNLEAPLWKVKTPLEPGRYKLVLVYDAKKAKESEVWDRLSSAGGRFEGGELWTLKVESNPVMITVKSLEEAIGKKR